MASNAKRLASSNLPPAEQRRVLQEAYGIDFNSSGSVRSKLEGVIDYIAEQATKAGEDSGVFNDTRPEINEELKARMQEAKELLELMQPALNDSDKKRLEQYTQEKQNEAALSGRSTLNWAANLWWEINNPGIAPKLRNPRAVGGPVIDSK
jgi:hypothetical protein